MRTLIFTIITVLTFSDHSNSSNSVFIGSQSAIAYDTITTEILSLVIGSNGRFGGADSGGVAGVRMDFFDFAAECDTLTSIPGDTRKYIFDASLIIGGIFGNDTILSNAIYGGGVDASSTIYSLTSESGPVLDKEIQTWTSGTLVNFDSSLAFRYKFFAPRSTVTYDFGAGKIWHENQQFITKELKVWAYDGENHDNITIGEVIDWDIPSDSDVENSGGVDTTRNLLYCIGAEYDQDSALECQENDLRYGGMAYGYYKRYVSDINTLGWLVLDSVPYGGYHEANARFVDPGWDDNQLYQKMAGTDSLEPWSHSHQDSQFVNLHSALTYLNDFDLIAGDTLVFYSVMSSVRNADDETPKSTVSRIQELTDKGRNFTRYFGCCHNLRGDLNTDGIDGNLVDLTFLVSRVFRGGPLPTCAGEGDVNADGTPSNVVDLSYLVDKIFRGGPPPYSCGEPPCNYSGCHSE
ncbi:MAG TPA: hypothetical protein VHP63_08050 [candidate division Zixibacteria bacterium]|nr:hypothetical protein [candidate division Zixibacteria bacterium]